MGLRYFMLFIMVINVFEQTETTLYGSTTQLEHFWVKVGPKSSRDVQWPLV